MAKCDWPTCSSEAIKGSYCYQHNRIYGDVKIKDHGKQEARKEQEKDYPKVKKAYMLVHSNCEVRECKKPAVDIHHKCGKIGELLTDADRFMAVCRKHHLQIEENPKWAKQEGYSISRLKVK